VYHSTDAGQNWTAINSGLSDSSVKTMIVSDSMLYLLSFSSKLFYRAYGSDQWIRMPIDTSVVPKTMVAGALAVSDHGRFFLGCNKGLFYTDDLGTNWHRAVNGLTDSLISFLKVKNNVVFAGAASGALYVSKNSGINWTNESNGLLVTSTFAYATPGAICSMEFAWPGIYISTSQGVWWRSYSYLTGIENDAEDESPIQIYPNPSHGVFNVEFSESTGDFFELSVMDVCGKEIYHNRIPAGSGVNNVATNALSPGIYSVSITTGDHKYSKKLVLE
jgi:PKD repeat protein